MISDVKPFVVPVVCVGRLEKHPDADSLSLTEVEGCPCIVRTGDMVEGDLAVYIPIESVVTVNTVAGAAMNFLKFKNGLHRVKAVRLRGIFSMGVLMKASQFTWATPPAIGDNVADLLGVEKYIEPDYHVRGGGGGYPLGHSDQERDPELMPIYDMESYRKFKRIFNDLEVVVTEKIHGTNARYIHDGERLWVGSHRTWKKPDGTAVWSKIAADLQLDAKLALFPGIGIYGEIFGKVQDLTYGVADGELRFAVFDVWDATKMRYFNWDAATAVVAALGLTMVPVLYRGPMNPAAVEPLASGNTTLGGDHIREGIVIKPAVEACNGFTGRTIAKFVGEQYLLRKGGSEFH